MPSEHDASASDCTTKMVEVIERLRAEGYLFNGGADEIASVAYRRWHSLDRRYTKHKSPKLDDRKRDLAKGLQAQFEPTGLYVRLEEWEGLADTLSPLLAHNGG